MNPPANPLVDHSRELLAIGERYGRRGSPAATGVYRPLDPYVTSARQERERALVRWARRHIRAPVTERRVLEVGCGTGDNLLDLIRLGFEPRNLVGVEMLLGRADRARSRLPAGVEVHNGDAATLDLAGGSFDVVLLFTVFTSLLDDSFRRVLAARVWDLVRPGGGVLWYDFVWDNPRNPDVRGVPVREVRRLFPEGTVRHWLLTLAPPIGRRLCRVAPALYPLVNALPFLRTHALCWVEKNVTAPGRASPFPLEARCSNEPST
jgi:SAM-dependent methyltransferase